MAYLIVSETPAATGGHNSPTLPERQYLGRTPPTGPKFRFDCTVGYPPLPNAQNVLLTAILDAIDLASNAAKRLQQGTTGGLFKRYFGDEPTDPWEPNMQAGAIVARRFRKVAAALQGGNTLYKCVSSCCDPNDSNPTVVCDTNAFAVLCKNEVGLCPAFWQLRQSAPRTPPARFLRAGVVLHEMFHLCFGPTCAWFRHDSTERRRNSAYCYEAFALMVKGYSPDLSKCKAAKP